MWTERVPSDAISSVRRPMAATFSLVLGLALGAGAVWAWARTQLSGERRAAEEKLALVK